MTRQHVLRKHNTKKCLQLRGKFPDESWDHWMRVDAQHMARECIVPELSRNKNIGVDGATMNRQEYERMLANIAWNEVGPGVGWGFSILIVLEESERRKIK